MTLLDVPAEKPDKSRAMAFTIAALAVAVIVIGWFMFRYYPEKRATEKFFDALVAGDTAQAYQIWKPGESYRMQDFLADWGPTGYYGPVKSYRIEKASARSQASGVVVTVSISPYTPLPDASDAEKSRKTRVVSVWVEAKDKSFSFPP